MSDFTLGRHEQAIDQMLTDQRAMKEDIAAIHSILSEQKGEKAAQRRVAAMAGGLAATVLGLLVKIGSWLYVRMNG